MLTRERPADAASETVALAPPSRLRRLWELPLWLHAAAAFVILVLLIPVVGLNAQYSADEGVVLAQARHLADGNGWLLDHPLAEVDPEVDAFPLQKADYGTDGIAAYAKHPLYPLLVAGALAAGGVAGVVLLSIAGTIAAAVVAALLARRLDRPLDRPLDRAVLWVTALASPLFFDGYVVMAHSLAAATAGGAALCALAVVGRRSLPAAAGVVICVGATVLLRTEGLFFGAALAAVLGVLWLWSRRSVRYVLLSVATLAVTAGAYLGERAWSRAILGAPQAGPETFDLAETGFVAGRIKGFVTTWLQPTQVDGAGPFLVLTAAAVLVAGTVVARRRPRERQAVLLFGGLAVALLVAGNLLAEPFGIPGLLPAFPLLFAGLAVAGRDGLADRPARVLAGVFALFSLAVVATQYAEGGSAEWGGRYFALGLPLIIPISVRGLRRCGAGLDPETRRLAAGVLVAASLVLTATAVATLRFVHDRTDELVSAVADRAVGDSTVVVTTVPALPRLAWDRLGGARWMLVEDKERLPDYLGRLHDAGIERVVLAGPEALADSDFGGYEVDRVDDSIGRGWLIADLAPGA